MLIDSLQYFLTEFAGLDYNLTGFTPGIMKPSFLGGGYRIVHAQRIKYRKEKRT
jgi:hypothetical protein